MMPTNRDEAVARVREWLAQVQPYRLTTIDPATLSDIRALVEPPSAQRTQEERERDKAEMHKNCDIAKVLTGNPWREYMRSDAAAEEMAIEAGSTPTDAELEQVAHEIGYRITRDPWNAALAYAVDALKSVRR